MNRGFSPCDEQGVLPLRSTGAKAQADTRNGMYETLTFAVVTELATESVHRHADDITHGRVVEAPDVLRDRARGRVGVAVAHEVLQQTELRPRQMLRHSVEVERAAAGSEAERPDLQVGR